MVQSIVRLLFVLIFVLVNNAYASNWANQSGAQTTNTTLPNDNSTGTTINKIAKLSSVANAIISTTSDTSKLLGVVRSGAGTSGNAIIATSGQVNCVFDGATTVGDYVQNSVTVNGDCHDAGSSYPSSGQVLGRVLSTNVAGGTFAVLIFGPEAAGSGILSINADTTSAQVIAGSNNISASTTTGTTTINGTLLAPKASPTFTGTIGTPLTASSAVVTNPSGNLTTVAPSTSGNLLTSNGTSWTSAAPATSGTVTSVAMTVPSLLSISGSPVTNSGTLALTYSGTALPVANGGTSSTGLTAHNVLTGNGTGAITSVAPSTSGNLLTSNGTDWTSAAPATSGTVTSVGMSVPSFLSIAGTPVTTSGTLAVSLSGTALPVANGGTSSTSLTAHNVLTGNGTGSINSVAPSTSGNLLTSNGTDWTSAAPATSGTVTSVAMSVPTFLSVSGTPVTGSGTLAVSLSGTALPVANGGTSSTSLTAHNVLTGNGTGSINSVAPGTSGNVLTSNGTDWTSAAAAAGGITSINSDSTAAQLITGSNNISASTAAGTTTINGTLLAPKASPTFSGTIGTALTASSAVVTDSSGNLVTVAPSTSGNILTSNGTSWASAAPATNGTVTSVAMTVPSFLSISGTPVTTSGTLGLSLSGTALPIANGGTGVTSVTTAPAATTFAGWDSNSNLTANNFIGGYTTTAQAGATTTLTVASTQTQVFTGSSGQTLKLPVASTLVLGQSFRIINVGTNTVTVQSSGGNLIIGLTGQTQIEVFCILTSGTSITSWSFLQPVYITGQQLAIQGNKTFSGAVTMASPTFTGTAAIASATFSGSATKGNCHMEPIESDLGNSASALAIDLSTANVFTATLSAATPTITFSNPQAGCVYTVVFTQDGTGNRVPSFAGTTTVWGPAGGHTFSTAASAVDKFTCVYNSHITSLMCQLVTGFS